jgi:hypothetical protein
VKIGERLKMTIDGKPVWRKPSGPLGISGPAGAKDTGNAIEQQGNSCPYRTDFRFLRALLVDLLAAGAGLVVLGARFCHANESAFSTLARSASPRHTFVLPRRPHAPFTGLKMLGSVVTNAIC